MYRIWMQGRFYKPLEKQIQSTEIPQYNTPKQSEVEGNISPK